MYSRCTVSQGIINYIETETCKETFTIKVIVEATIKSCLVATKKSLDFLRYLGDLQRKKL